MGDIGVIEKVILVPKPIKAPAFPRSVPDAAPATPITVPERELVPVRRGRL